VGAQWECSEREAEEGYRKWKGRINAIEKAVARNGHADLEKLATAGINRKALRRLLAVTAESATLQGHDSELLGLMRTKHRELKSLSQRVETITRETKRTVGSALSTVGFWVDHDGGGMALGMTEPELMTADLDVALAVCAMPVLAQRLKKEAYRFGRYLRALTRTDTGIVLLLVRCWIFRVTAGGAAHLVRREGRFRPRMDCLEELARLLTDTFEAAGKDRTFSADGLRKTFRRHGPRLIRLWLDNLLARFNVEAGQENVPVPVLLPALPSPGGKKSFSNQ
jgi:hypothetical protein